MEGLPFIPGNTFRDPTKHNFHRRQTLGYQKGYSIAKRPEVGIGGEILHYNQLNEKDLDELANFQPTLTYGQAKPVVANDFVPAHVALDKKVLRFYCYFKETVHESPHEFYRVRPCQIFYYLEDDSITVMEPKVENSGMPQGTFLRRQQLPKNDQGDKWHWTDMNNGINVTFYGRSFHIYDCDAFTKEFLKSEGIEVNPPEDVPPDPYTNQRQKCSGLKSMTTPSQFDKLKQFLEMDGKVLRFFCIWDDRASMFGERKQYILHFYLSDDTLEVREVHTQNDGHDPFPVLINRHKVPKNRYDVPSTFSAITLELTEREVKDYICPADLGIGKTVHIYGRDFLIYDCDNFTKAYYNQHFGITDFTPVNVKEEEKKYTQKMEIAPYNGLGSIEDSLMSCVSLLPQPPRKDYVKMMENDHKILRFEARLESLREEDKSRRFIISYRLSDDMIMIYEPPVKNSGIIGGKFLECVRVAKPCSTIEAPKYYGPQDFYIGAKIDVFKHRFIITGADHFVLKYMEAHKDQFPDSVIDSLRNKVLPELSEPPKEMVKGGNVHLKRSIGDINKLVDQTIVQMKRIGITDKKDVYEMFLRYNKDRNGYLGSENIKEICKKLHLPVDNDVIQEIVKRCTTNPQGKITLEDFRQFVENY